MSSYSHGDLIRKQCGIGIVIHIIRLTPKLIDPFEIEKRISSQLNLDATD